MALFLVFERFLIPDNRDDFFTCAQRSKIVRIILFFYYTVIIIFGIHENFIARLYSKQILLMGRNIYSIIELNKFNVVAIGPGLLLHVICFSCCWFCMTLSASTFMEWCLLFLQKNLLFKLELNNIVSESCVHGRCVGVVLF